MLDIGGEVQRIGNDDNIEAAVAEIDEFAGLDEKFGVGQAKACGGD